MNSSDFAQVEVWLKEIKCLTDDMKEARLCAYVEFVRVNGVRYLVKHGKAFDFVRNALIEYLEEEKSKLIKQLAQKGVTYDGP